MEFQVQNTSMGVQLLVGQRRANGAWQVTLVGTYRGGFKSTLFGPRWEDAGQEYINAAVAEALTARDAILTANGLPIPVADGTTIGGAR